MAVAARGASLRRGRLGAALGVLVLGLVAFSPTVAWWVERRTADLPGAREAAPLPDLPAPPALRPRVLRAYAPARPGYERALDELKVGARRRTRLLEDHFALYRSARAVLGFAQANALLALVEAETRNQAPALGRRSVFSSPEAALDHARRWLSFADLALRGADRVGRRDFAAELRALSPAPTAPEVVFRHARWIRRAANATHLPTGALAAIVDTEQAGASLAYGLSGALRAFGDTAALRAAQLYGRSGMSGEFSKTVGLAQMSWEDALRQESRLNALGVALGVPFPQNEAEGRALLGRPYANLLLTASRLRGYLNLTEGIGTNSTVPHTDARVYYLAPGWHNNPGLASSGQTWPYEWNAFFKACIYERLLGT